MNVRDLLSVAAQQRAWALREGGIGRRSMAIPSYLEFNNRLYLAASYRRQSPPLTEFTTLAEFVHALETAMFLVSDGHKDQAIPHLKASASVLKKHDWEGRESMRACALECLAQAQLDAGRIDDAYESAAAALRDYELLAEEEPGYLRANEGVYDLAVSTTECLLGHILTKKGDLDSAIHMLKRGVSGIRHGLVTDWEARLPNLVWGLELLAEALYQARQFEEAYNALTEIREFRRHDLHIVAGPIAEAIYRTNSKLGKVASELIESRASQQAQGE